uniref:Sorting nexin 10a n=1 Tax=Poecilia latipinna TaxID=48699 RepID=A0A3B3VZU7_9TELE
MLPEFVSVCVRDPRLHKDDRWHTHIDYEICLHTNSMCFRKKTSYVRRSYSDFVWLRHCLEGNALTMYFEEQRANVLMQFSFSSVFQNPLLLSDSRLHLFLQSDLSIRRIERCALGKTRYTVAEAIQLSRSGYSSSEDKSSYDSDCESSASSGLGLSIDTMARDSPVPFHDSNEGGFSN